MTLVLSLQFNNAGITEDEFSLDVVLLQSAHQAGIFGQFFVGTFEGLGEYEVEYALSCEVLSRDPFLIAAPTDTPYCKQAQIVDGLPYPVLDPALLAGESFLLVKHGQRIRQISDRVLASAGVTPKIVLSSRNYEMLRRLAARGMGYTLVPRQYAGILGGDEYQPQYFLIPEKYRAYWELSVVTLKDTYLSKAARAFLECFMESVK